MKSTFVRVAILALVILSITVVFFIGFKLNVAPHVQSEMDRWVGIATVCTAISSAIVGLISVWVMFDQKKVQDKLMDMQVSEHQPVFKVKIEQHAGLDESGKAFDYEDVKITIEDDSCTIEMKAISDGMTFGVKIVISKIGEIELTLPKV